MDKVDESSILTLVEDTGWKDVNFHQEVIGSKRKVGSADFTDVLLPSGADYCQQVLNHFLPFRFGVARLYVLYRRASEKP